MCAFFSGNFNVIWKEIDTIKPLLWRTFAMTRYISKIILPECDYGICKKIENNRHNKVVEASSKKSNIRPLRFINRIPYQLKTSSQSLKIIDHLWKYVDQKQRYENMKISRPETMSGKIRHLEKFQKFQSWMKLSLRWWL